MKMAFQDGIDCVLCISLHNLGLQLLLLLRPHSSNSHLLFSLPFSKKNVANSIDLIDYTQAEKLR